MTTIIQKADREISRITLGYPYAKMCLRCRVNAATDASHFWGRSNSATRYVRINVDALCRSCHDYFHDNPSEYKAWKIKQLGPAAWVMLQRMSATQVSREAAAEKFLNSIKNEKK